MVAFPGAAIPLHIFEDRYKTMVGEAEAAGTEFGIVLAKDGGVVNAGCTVVVETMLQRYPDGRFDVITRGQRRFEITSLDQEKEYLRGEIEYFDDDDWSPVTPDLRQRAIEAYGNVQRAMAELGNDVKEVTPDPGHPLLSFQLAQAVEDLDFQSMQLRSRSELERIKRFLEFSKEYIPRQQYAARMKRVAPLNGSGHRPLSV